MNVCTCALITMGIFCGELTLAQSEIRTFQTSTHPKPAEVKQINNTPVIYIHKTEQPANGQPAPVNQTRPTPVKPQQRGIKKCQHQNTGDDNKKKELKEPVQSN